MRCALSRLPRLGFPRSGRVGCLLRSLLLPGIFLRPQFLRPLLLRLLLLGARFFSSLLLLGALLLVRGAPRGLPFLLAALGLAGGLLLLDDLLVPAGFIGRRDRWWLHVDWQSHRSGWRGRRCGALNFRRHDFGLAPGCCLLACWLHHASDR